MKKIIAIALILVCSCNKNTNDIMPELKEVSSNGIVFIYSGSGEFTKRISLDSTGTIIP